jgi:hypothetical protein
MKSSSLSLALAALFALPSVAPAARFTYHGELSDGGAPANGAYDLRLRTFGAPGAKTPLGEATELPDVDVANGVFALEVDLPEGPLGNTYVEVSVRKAGSDEAYETLGAPQAMAKVNTGCWALDGNTGLAPNSFLGIADAGSTQNLDFRVQGRRGLRLQPNAIANTLSVVAGHPDNVVTANALGGVVSGGGRDTLANFVTENFGVVAGGTNNIAGNPFAGVGRQGHASVGGGNNNFASGNFSTIPGGFSNATDADQSFAAGTRAKIFTAHTGTFAWADSENANFESTGPNQFLIRASGGIGLNTATFGNAADLRLSEMVLKNPDDGGNVDLTLLTRTNRGYGLAVVPGAGGAAGEFFISETDARTSSVGFANRLRIDAAGTTFVQGGAVGTLSDARLKKNIAPIARPLETLLALRGHTFEYRDPAAAMNAPGPRLGFIAQEVRQAVPQWVAPTGKQGFLAVTPAGFEALAVEAIRDLKAASDVRIEALESENAALRSETKTLAARLARLEARIGQ